MSAAVSALTGSYATPAAAILVQASTVCMYNMTAPAPASNSASRTQWRYLPSASATATTTATTTTATTSAANNYYYCQQHCCHSSPCAPTAVLSAAAAAGGAQADGPIPAGAAQRCCEAPDTPGLLPGSPAQALLQVLVAAPRAVTCCCSDEYGCAAAAA